MHTHEILQRLLRPVLLIGAAACFISGAAGGESAMAAVTPVGTEAQNLVVSESSIQPIVGTWRENGVADARSLIIYADGRYELTYKDGRAFGMVKVTVEEHPDGSQSYWYSFWEGGGVVLEDKDTASPWYKAYTSANELWAAFAKDEKMPMQTDLYSGHDGAMHFVRSAENGYDKKSAGVVSAAPLQVQEQLDILARTAKGANSWFVQPTQAGDWHKWHYAVTDLNHDGNLEILLAKAGSFDGTQELRCEELNEGKWMRYGGIHLVGGSHMPDILTGEDAGQLSVMYDDKEKRYIYLFTETIMHGEFEAVHTRYALWLNGVLQVEELGFSTWQLSGYDGTVKQHYYLPRWRATGTEGAQRISAKRYAQLGKERFPNSVEKPAKIKWIKAEDLWQSITSGKAYTILEDSVDVFVKSTLLGRNEL